MAIGRLLSPKLSPPFNSIGSIPLTRRWVSSSMQDGRKFERVPDSEAPANKDIGQKGIRWYSLGGLLANLKQRITGNMLSMGKASGEDSVSPATKVVSLQNVAANKNCTLPSKEESGKRESTSVNKESLDNNSFAQENVLRSIQGERVDRPQEASSTDVSLGFFTEEVSNLKTEKAQSDLKIPSQKHPQNKLSNFFINPDPDKEVKLPLISEALSSSNSSMLTGGDDQHRLFGKMLSDPVQKIKSISKENDKHRFSGASQNSDFLSSFLRNIDSHENKSGERKTTFLFEHSGETVVPVAMSGKNLFDSLNHPTGNSTNADANPYGGKGKCASKGDAVKNKSLSFCATVEEESKGETLVMQNQTTLAATTAKPTNLTKKSLGGLSVEEHFPNKVMLRFLKEALKKKDIIKVFSEFGAVVDVQEMPGCIYKDALVTFETNSAVKKALKRGVVMVKNHYVVVEATSQGDMVERICIPDLIGDPDVPIALVKEPTRTVKIHPLEQDVSSNQIKEALRFCRSDISKFILGSSKTAAFVEFETEDGKERALAAHSISISKEKQLFISRIDIPRTTVARISNLSVSAERDLRKLCVPYGEIKKVFYRGKGIADVWFQISEWPNMLTILNSLNGKEIEGMKWVVRPATTVIPPEILRVLWEEPREKRYVKSVIHNLVREIEQPLDATRSYTLVTELLL